MRRAQEKLNKSISLKFIQKSGAWTGIRRAGFQNCGERIHRMTIISDRLATYCRPHIMDSI